MSKVLKVEFTDGEGKLFTSHTEEIPDREADGALSRVREAILRQANAFIEFPNLYVNDASFESEGPIFVNVSDIHFLTLTLEKA